VKIFGLWALCDLRVRSRLRFQGSAMTFEEHKVIVEIVAEFVSKLCHGVDCFTYFSVA
jgi:hypothetical protein